MMIKDRIAYTCEDLLCAHYEHMMIFILQYNGFCLREDAIELLMRVTQCETQLDYIGTAKRFVMFTRLVAPEIIELYELTNIISMMRGMTSDYYLILDINTMHNRIDNLREECRQHL